LNFYKDCNNVKFPSSVGISPESEQETSDLYNWDLTNIQKNNK